MLMRGGVLYVFLNDALSCGDGDGDYRLTSKLFFFLI